MQHLAAVWGVAVSLWRSLQGGVDGGWGSESLACVDSPSHLLPQKHLAGLGLTEAIDKNKADLSRMSGKKDLYLASVFHATAFEWDTEGNPFDQDIYGREELRSPKLFYADHPFKSIPVFLFAMLFLTSWYGFCISRVVLVPYRNLFFNAKIKY